MRALGLRCLHGAVGRTGGAVVSAGFVTSITALLRDNPNPTEHEIREGLSGNFCRCTGYQGIVNAVHRAAQTISGAAAAG